MMKELMDLCNKFGVDEKLMENLLKNLLKSFLEEREENKKVQMEREKTSTVQDNITQHMKCPICGGDKFKLSFLNSKYTQVTSYYDGFEKTYDVDSTMCLQCGYLVTMADMNSLCINKIETYI
ncbi:MAG: hypothetical protein ACLR3R_18765 [Clostridium paraputrificum]